MSAIIIVLNTSTSEYKEEKMEHDLSLSLVLEQPGHMPASEFAQIAVGMARSLRNGDGLVLAHVDDPSEDLRKMLRAMERQSSHFSSPVGRSVLFPLVDPHIISLDYWRDAEGRCHYGWCPARAATELVTNDELASVQNWVLTDAAPAAGEGSAPEGGLS